MQNILWLIGRAKCLRIGTRQRRQSGIEGFPNTRIRIARLQRLRLEPGDAFQIGQRRHIHNRQARHAGSGNAIHQLSNTW